MQPITYLALACFLTISATVGASERRVQSDDEDRLNDRPIRARATLQGAPGSGISGVMLLKQLPTNKYSPVTNVEVTVRIKGLTPGKHGMHIHEAGNCADTTIAFGGAGGHFDPGPFSSSNPVDANHPFHMGDLPNLEVNDEGVGWLRRYSTSRITLSAGPLSVFDTNGSAVIIHQNPDLGMTGVSGASGGPRVACGIIQLDN